MNRKAMVLGLFSCFFAVPARSQVGYALMTKYREDMAAYRQEKAAEEKRTAVYVAGAAMVATYAHAYPVLRATIIPDGKTLGSVTQDVPKLHVDPEMLRRQLQVSLAGRAAEMVIYGEISTGGHSDMAAATEIARQLAGDKKDDAAIGQLLKDAETQAMGILSLKKDMLKHLALVLLEKKTMDGDEIRRFIQNTDPIERQEALKKW